MQFRVPLFLALAALANAHPMGNSSVSHYSRFEMTAHGVELTYVLDLAEQPTVDLLRLWGLERTSPRADLDRKAAEQARTWAGNLSITSDGKPVTATFVKAELVLGDGARITSHLHLDTRPGKLEYEDRNFDGRAGWKEIVIRAGTGGIIDKASESGDDRSKALSEYPADATVTPPQNVRASIDWRIAQPTRADFLSRLLHQRELSFGMIVIALFVAFGLGAAHALTPGHGKTIVAAYLVGSRGTLKHAAFLGAMVTFTHTVSVFLLGLATLFLFQYVVPEKITQVLGIISGLSIVAIGGWMMYKRFRGLQLAHAHVHAHHHHDHDHPHDHHQHDHHHEHVHSHGGHVHSHGPGGHVHSHDMPEEVSWGSLVALGASGGLVPCESALVLLLSAIALGRAGLGLLLLISFSLGLAIVLMGIGVLVIYAKHLIPEGKSAHRHPFFQWVPVLSAGIVVCVGVLMTVVSLGWLQPGWMI